MRTEKIGLKTFLRFEKMSGVNSPKYPCRREMQFAKHELAECRAYTRKRNRIWDEERRKVAFGRISWEEMLTQSKFAEKITRFMNLFGLIDQFKSVTLD